MEDFDELLKAWEQENNRHLLKKELDALVPLRSMQRRIVRTRTRILRGDLFLVFFYAAVALWYIGGVVIGATPVWHLINALIWSGGVVLFGFTAKRNRQRLIEAQLALDKTEQWIKDSTERYDALT